MAGLRDELAKIYEKHGQISPPIMYDEVSSPRHPLHSRYEWNDKIAGKLHRLDQMRRDIRSVMVTYVAPSGNPEEVRQYMSVRDEAGYAYRRTEEIAQDPIVSALVLRDAERAWRDLYKRYGHLAEFLDLVRGDVTV